MLTDFGFLTKELSAGDLGISGVDLKTATTYNGTIVDITGYRDLMLIFEVDVTGATTVGTAQLKVTSYRDDGLTPILQDAILIDTIVTTADGNVRVYIPHLGANSHVLSETLTGAPTVTQNTADAMRLMKKVKFSVTVTVAYDSATSARGNLTLRVGR